MIMTSYVLLTYLVFKKQRESNQLLIFMIWGFWLISLAYFIPTLVMKGRHQDIGCADDHSYRFNMYVQRESTPPVALCYWQSITIQFMIEYITIMWCAMSLDLFRKVVLEKQIPKELQRKYDYGALAVALVVPMIFLIASLANYAHGRVDFIPCLSRFQKVFPSLTYHHVQSVCVASTLALHSNVLSLQALSAVAPKRTNCKITTTFSTSGHWHSSVCC